MTTPFDSEKHVDLDGLERVPHSGSESVPLEMRERPPVFHNTPLDEAVQRGLTGSDNTVYEEIGVIDPRKQTLVPPVGERDTDYFQADKEEKSPWLKRAIGLGVAGLALAGATVFLTREGSEESTGTTAPDTQVNNGANGNASGSLVVPQTPETTISVTEPTYYETQVVDGDFTQEFLPIESYDAEDPARMLGQFRENFYRPTFAADTALRAEYIEHLLGPNARPNEVEWLERNAAASHQAFVESGAPAVSWFRLVAHRFEYVTSQVSDLGEINITFNTLDNDNNFLAETVITAVPNESSEGPNYYFLLNTNNEQ